MARNRRKLTESNIDKLIKEGRGQGERESYQPWITVHDLSSKGFKHRVRGNTVDRTYHLLSDNEWYYFLILDFSPKVVDIRDQYPLLPIDETIKIARDMGVQHPRDSNTNELAVLTTDFLVDAYDGSRESIFPRTLKPAKDLQSKRKIIKLEIERRFWLKRDKELGIVTDSQLPVTLCRNLEHLHDYVKLEQLGDDSRGCVGIVKACFNADLAQGSRSIVEVANDCDAALALPVGSSLATFFHLLANCEWPVDLYQQIDTGRPLNSLLLRR